MPNLRVVRLYNKDGRKIVLCVMELEPWTSILYIQNHKNYDNYYWYFNIHCAVFYDKNVGIWECEIAW